MEEEHGEEEDNRKVKGEAVKGEGGVEMERDEE